MTKPKKKPNTGVKQAKAGRGGTIPPGNRRFGQPEGNPINKLGRPKSFDALRALAQEIAAEELATAAGEKVTRIMALLRLLSSSRNAQDRKTFLEYAYGKVPQPIVGGGPDDAPVQVAFNYGRFIHSATRSTGDSDASSQDESDLHGQTVGQDADVRRSGS